MTFRERLAVMPDRHHNTVISTRGNVEVARVGTGLAHEFQIGELFDHIAPKRHALLRKYHRVAALHLLHHSRGIGVGIGVDDHLMIFQSIEPADGAKYIGVVVDDGNFHATFFSVARATMARLNVGTSPPSLALARH